MKSPLVACIVESRPVPNLYSIIQDKHLAFLPEGTPLVFYHGPDNQQVAHQIAANTMMERKVILKELPQTFDIHQYNHMFTDQNFWTQFLGYNRVLIFQSDSELFRTGIEEFYEWDYIGAPWLFIKDLPSGNGGLSLRNPEVMIEVCKQVKYTGLNEDILICKYMHEHGVGKLAPREVAQMFAVETTFCLGSLGQHSMSKWLSVEQMEQIRNFNKINKT